MAHCLLLLYFLSFVLHTLYLSQVYIVNIYYSRTLMHAFLSVFLCYFSYLFFALEETKKQHTHTHLLKYELSSIQLYFLFFLLLRRQRLPVFFNVNLFMSHSVLCCTLLVELMKKNLFFRELHGQCNCKREKWKKGKKRYVSKLQLFSFHRQLFHWQ